jgi:hypothetical protein
MRDQPAAIEFGEDAAQPDLVTQRAEPFGNLLRRADERVGANTPTPCFPARRENAGYFGASKATGQIGGRKKQPESRTY